MKRLDYNSLSIVSDWLKTNQSGTVKEFLDAQNELIDKERREAEEKKKWYENCVGSYFLIRFHSEHLCVVHLNSTNWKEATVYHVTLNPYHLSVERCESGSRFNCLWLKNPYESTYGNNSTTCEQITKEEYDRVVDLYDKMFEMGKEVKLNFEK